MVNKNKTLKWPNLVKYRTKCLAERTKKKTEKDKIKLPNRKSEIFLIQNVWWNVRKPDVLRRDGQDDDERVEAVGRAVLVRSQLLQRSLLTYLQGTRSNEGPHASMYDKPPGKKCFLLHKHILKIMTIAHKISIDLKNSTFNYTKWFETLTDQSWFSKIQNITNSVVTAVIKNVVTGSIYSTGSIIKLNWLFLRSFSKQYKLIFY